MKNGWFMERSSVEQLVHLKFTYTYQTVGKRSYRDGTGKSHMIHRQNMPKLTEYNLPSQKYTVTVDSRPISSYAHRTHTCLRFYVWEFVPTLFQIFRVITFFFFFFVFFFLSKQLCVSGGLNKSDFLTQHIHGCQGCELTPRKLSLFTTHN